MEQSFSIKIEMNSTINGYLLVNNPRYSIMIVYETTCHTPANNNSIVLQMTITFCFYMKQRLYQRRQY